MESKDKPSFKDLQQSTDGSLNSNIVSNLNSAMEHQNKQSINWEESKETGEEYDEELTPSDLEYIRKMQTQFMNLEASGLS